MCTMDLCPLCKQKDDCLPSYLVNSPKSDLQMASTSHLTHSYIFLAYLNNQSDITILYKVYQRKEGVKKMHGEEVMSHLLSYCLCLLCQIDCMHVQQHAQRQCSEHLCRTTFLTQFSRNMSVLFCIWKLCIRARGSLAWNF